MASLEVGHGKPSSADTLIWDKGASDFQGTQQCTYCDLSKCVSSPPGHNVGAGNSGMGTKGWRDGWQEIYKGKREWKSVNQDDSMYKMSKQPSKINRKTVDKRTPWWNHSIPNKHLQELIYRKRARSTCLWCMSLTQPFGIVEINFESPKRSHNR